MSRALVIGYGNSSRRDDGVGHYMVEKIKCLTGGKVDTLALHQLGPELAETIKDYNLVIFVDAHSGEYTEGLRVTPVEAVYRPSAFTHFMSPGSLLALAKGLYQKEPRAFTVSVRGHNFDFGTELSEETRKYADSAVNRIIDMITRWKVECLEDTQDRH